MSASRSKAEWHQRLGKADIQQIRLLLRVPPEQRVQTMLDMQALGLNMWYDRLRKSHPHLNEMELARLVFRRSYRNAQGNF
jgi:hypothetical protein